MLFLPKDNSKANFRFSLDSQCMFAVQLIVSRVTQLFIAID